MNGQILEIPYNCRCLDETIAEKEKQEKQAIKDSRRDSLLNNSNIDLFFIKNDFQVYTPQLLPLIDRLDWIVSGRSLFVYGGPGNHKTGQITAICKKAINEFYSVRYYRSTEIPYQRDFYYIKKVDLLVIDNFGRDSNFENSRSALFDLIDYRIHNYKSCILITNESISTKFDEAFVDRIKMFEKIKIDGESKRGLK